MASVLDPPPAPSKADARLEQELGKATGRIRLERRPHRRPGAGGPDARRTPPPAIVLDKWLELPEWSRQLVARRVRAGVRTGRLPVAGPAAAAARSTRGSPPGGSRGRSPTPRTCVINWVDLRDKDLPGRGAGGGRRARRSRASPGPTSTRRSSRSQLVWLAAAAGLLLAVLAALFVVFKPAPFLSLVSRTFNPFTVTTIASRTELTDPGAARRRRDGDGRRPGDGAGVRRRQCPRPRRAGPGAVAGAVQPRGAGVRRVAAGAGRARPATGCCGCRSRSCRTGSGTPWPAATRRRPSTESRSAPGRCSRRVRGAVRLSGVHAAEAGGAPATGPVGLPRHRGDADGEDQPAGQARLAAAGRPLRPDTGARRRRGAGTRSSSS